MYSWLSPEFFGFFLLFIVSLFVSFFLPGSLVISHKRFSPGLYVFLSFMIGMVLWGIQGYIFGYLGFRLLTYVYLLTVIIIAYRRRGMYRHLRKDIISSVRAHIFPAVLITIGVIGQLVPVFGSGMLYRDGVRFFGVNAHDGVMHLGFIRSIITGFPPMEPGAVGNLITNYHYWSDLIIAELIRMWALPISHTFFQYMPIFIGVMSGIGIYQLIRVLGFSAVTAVFGIFFFFFAGDAVYLLMLVIHQTFSFAAPAIDNGVTQFLNMPNAMARPVFFGAVIMLVFWLKERNLRDGILLVLFIASLVGIKVYYGMFAVLGICLVVFGDAVAHFISSLRHHTFLSSLRKTITYESQSFTLVGLLAILSAAIYFPPNQHSGGLGWYPLEWPKLFLGAEALDWRDWWLRRQVYEAAGNTRNILILDAAAILVSLLAVHGTRIIGFLPVLPVYRKLGWRMLLFFLPGLYLFHILGFYTLQESGGFNVFNFLVVGAVILSLFSALFVGFLWEKKKFFWRLLAIIILFLSLPRTGFEIQHFLNSYADPVNNSALISRGEIEGLQYLSEQTKPDAIVQSHVRNALDQTTPYVSYFSGRMTYLTGTGLQKTHNQPIGARIRKLNGLFDSETYQLFHKNARTLGIDYIYLRKTSADTLPYTPTSDALETVFENDAVRIYKVR